MPLPKINPTTAPAWKKLGLQFEADKKVTIQQHFKNEPDRMDNFTIQWEDFYIDFSKNRLSKTTKKILLDLAKECQLKEAIAA